MEMIYQAGSQEGQISFINTEDLEMADSSDSYWRIWLYQ